MSGAIEPDEVEVLPPHKSAAAAKEASFVAARCAESAQQNADHAFLAAGVAILALYLTYRIYLRVSDMIDDMESKK